MKDGIRITLFDLPEAIELDLCGYFTACEIVSLLMSSKRASQYNKTAIWREMLITGTDLLYSASNRKHRKKNLSKKVLGRDHYREAFINTWRSTIRERRKDFHQELLVSYDSDVKLSIHKQCIRTAVAAAKSHELLANPKQTACRHGHILLILGKTIYPTAGFCTESRELMLNKFCSNCASTCYEKIQLCICCRGGDDFSSNYICATCSKTHKFTGHSNHPRLEFTCPRDYFLEKEYTIGCFNCGLAFVSRIASSSKFRWQKSASVSQASGSDKITLITSKFICPSRQNVFRNMLQSSDGQSELIFRMKTGDMILHHLDSNLST